jgi:hypothetical protein
MLHTIEGGVLSIGGLACNPASHPLILLLAGV